MHQLNPQDAQFLYAETAHNLTHVTSISIYDPSTVPGGRVVRFTEIIEHVRERLGRNPLLSRRLLRLPLELDYPYWVEDEFFDLEAHIHHGRLPDPGDWRQFCIHMARYHSRPLDMNRPPWEMFVVEGLDRVEGLPPGCYAVATKIHHAVGDGTSLTRFFSTLMDADPQGHPLVPQEEYEEKAEIATLPPLRSLIKRALRNNLGSPLRLAGTLLRSTPNLYHAAQESVSKRDTPRHAVPATRFNVDLSPHKMVDVRIFALDDLRKIRKLHPGVTINDVVLAVCAGALRRYLEHHEELPEHSLVAWVPINARARTGDDGKTSGNNITAMTTEIHTDEADALRRLKKIHRATQASKEARTGVSARLMTDITQHVPAATQILASRLILNSGVTARVCNLFISNVPGPQVPTYMNGARMLRSIGLAPLADGMGLFIATPSYAGQMSFNVISTREVLPDIEFFMQCIESSMEELLALTRDEREAAPAGEKAAAASAKARAGKSKSKAAAGKARAKRVPRKASAGRKKAAAPRKRKAAANAAD